MSLLDEIFTDHQHAKQLMAKVAESKGAARIKAFQLLTKTLAVHEAAEEVLVHPLIHSTPAGKAIEHERLVEEQKSARVLGKLQRMDPASTEFDTAFSGLRNEVLAHAKSEEEAEHPKIRQAIGAPELERLGSLFRKLEDAGMAAESPDEESIDALIERTRGVMQASVHAAKT